MPPMSPYSPGPALPGRPRVLGRRCVPAPPRPQHPPKAPYGHCAPRPLPPPTSPSASQPPGALRPQAAPPPRAGPAVGTCSALLLVPHPPVSPSVPGSRRRGAATGSRRACWIKGYSGLISLKKLISFHSLWLLIY